MIAEINWDAFSAKFTANKQNAFERLCYLLFCKEFGKSTGIFRFKNHAGIETSPIQKDNLFIGWQAKFYGTRLAENEGEFIASLDKTKRDYPEINKIIFYTNQDFGQGKKGSDPVYKTRVEDHAKSEGVEIEWRTASYFESPFVCEENFGIAQHYFSQSKGIIEAIQALAEQTQVLLKQIRSDISFGDKTIKLDRSGVVTGLIGAVKKYPLLIVSGSAGVGKTALLKDFYDQESSTSPIYVLKANQLSNIHSIDQLLQTFDELTFAEFLEEHKDVPRKYVIVDSAEKLSDIEDLQVVQTFLSALLKAKWNVVFTVRHSYVDDLKFQLKEFYNAGFQSINVPSLSDTELEQLSKVHSFKLPKNERLTQLIQTPLYLSEYLRSYQDIDGEISYADFRELIWRKQIQNSAYQARNIHIRREQCFLQLAKERANTGNFFVKGESYDQEAIAKLSQAGIIERESNIGGYFITHDAYEEWALDKIIERAFRETTNFKVFLQQIGSTLPIRRAFRNWLSDKLSTNDSAAQKLIEFAVSNPSIKNHWKDEVLVAVLLSDYANTFFGSFKQQLLPQVPQTIAAVPKRRRSVSDDDSAHKSTLLHRILFLLRVACKTVDESMVKLLGIAKAEEVAFRTVFTTPKGSGWDCVIAFLYENRNTLQLQYMNAILPILHDWTTKNKEGATTQNAGLLALYYYTELTNTEGFYFGSHDETKDKLLATILNSAKEIVPELTQLVDEIVAANDGHHTTKHYEFAKACLGPLTETTNIASSIPTQVMRLANLFWVDVPNEDSHPYGRYRNDIEDYFGLAHHDHYPASAYQTPILLLLRTAPGETVNFILNFTNKAIEYFATSSLARSEIYEIELHLDDAEKPIKQYNCFRIWSLYRGGQPAPAVLESMHMALENWMLLHLAKLADPETMEVWCLYLLRKSRSASITAVVASLVLAEPQKLFNVAKVLFRTKELFFVDTSRMQFDRTSARSLYSIGFFDPNDIFRTERMKSCDDKHRSRSLENLALNYQVFLSEGEPQDVFAATQEAIWKILDEHYANLPDKAEETNEDKTWRLYLARMDRRKMNISTERRDEGLVINFNPDMAPELKEFSESSLAISSEAMKYLPLVNWAQGKFERKSGTTSGNKYDEDHKLAIADVKTILEGLANDTSEHGSFSLFYRAAPAFASAVLLRDSLDKLDDEERNLCKEVTVLYASAALQQNYYYQISDGIEPSIRTLPILLHLFPEDSKAIKQLLLLTLFLAHPVGMSGSFFDMPMAAVQELWKTNPEDANTIFLGYLLLKPKFSALCEKIRDENFSKRGEPGFSYAAVLKRLQKTCKPELTKVALNEVRFGDIGKFEDLDAEILVQAFLLLPPGSSAAEHNQFVQASGPSIAHAIKNNDREDRLNYYTEHRFLEKFAHFVLSSPKENIEAYLKPFIDSLGEMKDESGIFEEFIVAEDHLKLYEEFWMVWSLFYPKIVEVCGGEHPGWRSEGILRKYLFASVPWNDSAKEWHSLRNREKAYFKKVADDLGRHPSTLYSLSKLLNGIGKGLQDDGVSWISGILQKHADALVDQLKKNTVYYMENFVRGYVLKNRTSIRKSIQLKSQILVILDFLLETGSVTAYMLREDIL